MHCRERFDTGWPMESSLSAKLSQCSELFWTNHLFATFSQGFKWDKATQCSKFNSSIKNKKVRSNHLEFQPSFIVKLHVITVLKLCGACFREQSKFFKSVICLLSILTSC